MTTTALEKGTFLDFGFSAWGGQLQVGDEVSVQKGETTVPTAAVKVTKRLLDCELAKKIQSGDNALRRRIGLLGFAYRPGFVFLPLGVVRVALDDVAAWRIERKGLVDQMADQLETLKADDRKRLGPMYCEADYPTPERLRDSFSVRAVCRSLGDPANLAEVDAQLLADQRAEQAEEWSNQFEEWRQAMRVTFSRLIGGLTEALGYKPDGKPRRFEKTTVSNLQGWINLFDAKNIADDQELSALVSKARALVEGAEPEELRADLATRDALARSLSAVTEAAKGLATEEAPRRRFRLRDDKAA